MASPVFATTSFVTEYVEQAINQATGTRFTIVPGTFTSEHIGTIVGVDLDTNMLAPYQVDTGIVAGSQSYTTLDVSSWQIGDEIKISDQVHTPSAIYPVVAGTDVTDNVDLDAAAEDLVTFINSIQNLQSVTLFNSYKSRSWTPGVAEIPEVFASGQLAFSSYPTAIAEEKKVMTFTMTGAPEPAASAQINLVQNGSNLGYLFQYGVQSNGTLREQIAYAFNNTSFGGPVYEAVLSGADDIIITATNLGTLGEGSWDMKITDASYTVDYTTLGTFSLGVPAVQPLVYIGFPNGSNLNYNNIEITDANTLNDIATRIANTGYATIDSVDTINSTIDLTWYSTQYNMNGTYFNVKAESSGGSSYLTPENAILSGQVAYSPPVSEVLPQITITFISNGAPNASTVIDENDSTLSSFTGGTDDYIYPNRTMAPAGKLILFDNIYAYVICDMIDI